MGKQLINTDAAKNIWLNTIAALLFLYTSLIMTRPIKTVALVPIPCIKRDKSRNKTHGEDAVKVVYKKSTEFEQGIVVDINKPLKECIDEILSHLPKP